MVRASYYIGYVVWEEIKKLTTIPDEVSWETWIRLDPKHSSDENAPLFEANQDHFQCVTVVWIPVFLSVIALLALPYLEVTRWIDTSLAGGSSHSATVQSLVWVLSKSLIPSVIVAALVAAFWTRMYRRILKTCKLSATAKVRSNSR